MIEPKPFSWYQHRDGGVYVVDSIAKYTDRDELCVIYTHRWPFETGIWVRPLTEWTPERFRKLDIAEVNELVGGDRHEARLKIAEAKRDRKAAELAKARAEEKLRNEANAPRGYRHTGMDHF